ncbi:MAG: PhzF family phenazine biosynthesis protein [Ktedonobacterales bacterium]
MTTHPYLLVDAFTTTALGGNPCAVVLDADPLDEATMQSIAREMNLSETAFVLRSQRADVGARYFTPTLEVPLAGHPTIATMAALLAARRLPATVGDASDGGATITTTLTLELKAGVITVEITSGGQGLPLITMLQPAPRFLRVYEPSEMLAPFGLEPDDLLPDAPIQTVSTGTPQLMVPVRDHDALRRVTLDVTPYQTLRNAGDFFSPHFFCLQGATPQGQTFARHFVPPGVSEDPATGSATGGMAAYLWRYGLITSPRFTAEQGHWIQRPSIMQVEVIGEPTAITGVKVGGSAVPLIEGRLTLPGK